MDTSRNSPPYPGQRADCETRNRYSTAKMVGKMKATATVFIAILAFVTLSTFTAERATAQSYAATKNAKRVYAIKQNQFASRARSRSAIRSRNMSRSRTVRGAGASTLAGRNQMNSARLRNQRRISRAGSGSVKTRSAGSFSSAYSKNSFNRSRRLQTRRVVRPAVRRPTRTITTRAFSVIR